ncbi:MAG: glycosyltransferase family 4 protein [Cephaloticoccus sp.]|nr:glycosyltransferase family 4 protein [Cephaloticoccus sp.]MCF7759590.1 glycosyltransferase family 4 protein [Cephaloticoccus sp.]
MTEKFGWQFDLEVHPPGWNFPAGKSWVAGWLWSNEGRLISDLRAWIDGRSFLAIHGLPKPGLDERFLQHPGPPYLGFTIQINPHAGARLFRFEVRDEHGNWRELFRTPITVDPQAGPCPRPKTLAGILPIQMDSLLRHHAAHPDRPWAVLADETVSTALGEPLDSLPNPPFHGALEEPREIGWVRYGRISVTGWLAHRTSKIIRVTAMIDPVLEVSLLHGLHRTDIDGVFADLPGRETSAFLGLVDLPTSSSTPALLKVFAELENGEKHLVFAQRFSPRILAGAESPLPPLSKATYLSALWALYRSVSRHHLPKSPWSELRPALRSAWESFATEAPASRSPKAVMAPELPAENANTPLQVMVVTHNLNFEGAPWFIFELACFLAYTPGTRVRIVSPQEGPLRAVFEQAGLPVQVINVDAVLAAQTPEEFHSALANATSSLPWATTDIVIGNTMVTFWAVHAARLAGKAALLYVHESSPVRRFFARHLAPAILTIAEEAFRLADRVVYTAASTQAVHARINRGGNAVLMPSWVDVARVDAFVSSHEAASLRRKHGLDPNAVLLVNIGSLCERKGQHIFIQAADLLKEELGFTYPDCNIVFVMVGSRPGLYLEMLAKEVTRRGLAARVTFVPETGEIFDFYRMADIFVCTSFEESFPRVLLESAAFGLPIVTTNVNGIPEMLATDEAWLTPPGDRYRLAAAIKSALEAHFAGDRSRSTKARAKVMRKYHQKNSLPLHATLARAAAHRHP